MIRGIFNGAGWIGWVVVNVIIGGQLVSALSGGVIPSWAGILILAILTTLVSIYGYRYVHRYERYAWIPMAIIFALMFFVALPHFHMIAPSNTTTAAEIAGLLSFGGAVYGFATGWSSYAADYNVNQPENTRPARVFWLTFLGIFIPCVVLETLGMLLAAGSPNIPGGQLLAFALTPLGSVGKVLVFFLALSIIANNMPNDYSLGLSMQVLGRWWQRVPRYLWTLIGAVVYVVIALLIAGNFNQTMESFLLLVAYWLGPWAIILLVEHYIIRKGIYNVEDWNNPRRLPIGWAAMVSMAVGLFGVFLGFAQTLVWNGQFIPVMGYVGGLVNKAGGGMDVGFELGVVFSLVVYLILRPIEVRADRTRTFGTEK